MIREIPNDRYSKDAHLPNNPRSQCEKDKHKYFSISQNQFTLKIQLNLNVSKEQLIETP